MDDDVNKNVVRWYKAQFDGLSGHCFLLETPATVEQIQKLLPSTFECFGFHCCDETWQKLNALGYEVGQERWSINSDGLLDFDAYSMDKHFMFALLKRLVSVSKDEFVLSRYARVRRRCRNGEIIRDYPEIPYTNIRHEDWV